MALIGYVGKSVHTVQELADLLQQCDPTAYVCIEVGTVDEPRHFVIADLAVDETGRVCMCASERMARIDAAKGAV